MLKTGMLLLDEEEITGDDDFQSALFGEVTDTGVMDHAEEIVAEVMEQEPHEPVQLKEADLVATDLLDSFLDGLGINRAELRPETDLGELMQNAGEVMREFEIHLNKKRKSLSRAVGISAIVIRSFFLRFFFGARFGGIKAALGS